MLTDVEVVQVTAVVVTGSVVTITPADVVDTLSDREIGTANPGMDTCKQIVLIFCCYVAPFRHKLYKLMYILGHFPSSIS
jgi:hypothetical protein